ncbi:secreted protein [Mycobacterium tuberculosis]|uniref:hyaluronidase/chondrosulfatase n=1 Tax=Mycobacterium tuberculosis TaxID=1773 RepID=UPI0005DF881F|nr:hyaluronidase/chondrosulfatase [Mycobacterium tuberculosis]CML55875.1 secreted protein [Mycobacterium tuberculosis]CMR80872.1 secreted protein [Mycobacterium tuberculosis]
MTEPRPVFAVVISAGLSAIPMVGGPLQTVFDAIEERTRHRAETTTREICESVGGADTVLSRIEKNPELEPLLSQAIEAATRTSMEAKRRLLAQAAAAALEDDQKVEPASLIVATLSQLEPVHIHALVRLAKAAKSSPDQDEIQRREVMRAASKVEPVPVLAALIQTGVAIATTTVWHGNGTGTPAEESGHILIHDVSDFGHRLLAYLRAADAGAELLILPSGGSAPTGDHPTPHPSTSR